MVVSEAFGDNGKNRYVPVPDYLVRADIAAKYLPTDLRNGVTLNASVSGTQRIYGYAPKRFSLAIKRHRKQLDLVVITHFRTVLDEINGWYTTPCSENDSHKTPDEYDTFFLTWNSENRTQSIKFEKKYGGYGFDGSDTPSDGTLDVVVLTKTYYDNYIQKHNLFGISTPEDYNQIKNQLLIHLKAILSSLKFYFIID